MRRCGKRYATAEAAARSKRGRQPGATPERCVDPKCGGWHLPKPSPARAGRGSMRAAVAVVLAGQATVAEAAREHDVDPVRLDDAAWDAVKLVVLERDSYTCQVTGELAVDVHHIIRRGIGGTADPVIAYGTANLVSVSRAEHDRCHAKDPELYERGFWRWSTEKPGAVPIKVPGPFGSTQSLWLLPNGKVSVTSPAEAAA